VTVDFEAPSRRFLHICYCCEDTDSVVDFYVNVLDMKEVMRNPLHPSDGSLLGIEGEIVSEQLLFMTNADPGQALR